ncbi:MAG TPA: hypothetical protein VGJ45_06205 [Pseudonocardiaceae bacterium]|jgi:hypothetical protein
MNELGAAIGEFRTNNGRRVWTGLGCLVVGVLAGYAGLWFILVAEPRMPGGGNEGPGPGFLLGAAVCGLGFAGILLVLAILHRREHFELYSDGLVHVAAGRQNVLRWADISTVRIVDADAPTGPRQGRNNWLKRLLGAELVCVLVLGSGRRLRFNAFTADARTLADWIRAAVEDGATPRRS